MPEQRPKGLQEIKLLLGILGSCLGGRAVRALWTLVLVAAAGTSIAALAPVFLKFLVDCATASSYAAAALFAVCYAGALTLTRALAEVRAAAYGSAEQYMIRLLTVRSMTHALSLPSAVLAARSTGSVRQTIESGVAGYRILLQQFCLSILPALLETFTLSVVLLFWLDHIYFVLFACFAAAYALVVALCARPVVLAARRTAAANIEAQSQFVDCLINHETIRVHAGVDAVTAFQDKLLANLQSGWRDLIRARLLAGLLISAVLATGLLSGLLVGLDAVQKGQDSIGDLILMQACLLQIIRPLEMLAAAMRDIGQGAVFARALNCFLALPPEYPSSPESAPSTKPVEVRFDRVSLGGRDGQGRVSDVSFSIPAGAKAALVGLSGSGKSTLLRLIMRLCDPDDGEILLGGVATTRQDPRTIRRNLRAVLQDDELLNLSLGDNISFPDDHPASLQMAEAIEKSGLAALVERLPQGLDTRVGERGAGLSGGELQRVIISRALCRPAGLLIADEPASALDAPSRSKIMSALFDRTDTRTVIVVSHRLSEVADADLILVMCDGRLVEQGNHSELLARGGHYARLWADQS